MSSFVHRIQIVFFAACLHKCRSYHSSSIVRWCWSCQRDALPTWDQWSCWWSTSSRAWWFAFGLERKRQFCCPLNTIPNFVLLARFCTLFVESCSSQFYLRSCHEFSQNIPFWTLFDLKSIKLPFQNYQSFLCRWECATPNASKAQSGYWAQVIAPAGSMSQHQH